MDLEFFSVMCWKQPAQYPPLHMKRQHRGNLRTVNLWSPCTHGEQQLSGPVLTVSGNGDDFRIIVVLGAHLDSVVQQSLLEMKLRTEFFSKLQMRMDAEFWV